jgi:hypothetical protein
MIGRAIRVNGTPTTVVGVMPPELLILGTDLWLPWPIDPSQMPRNGRQFTLIARLAPGATIEQLNAELALIAAQTTASHAGEFEEYQGWRLAAIPWTDALMREVRPAAWLLIGAVALVLLCFWLDPPPGSAKSPCAWRWVQRGGVSLGICSPKLRSSRSPDSQAACCSQWLVFRHWSAPFLRSSTRWE